MSTGSGSYYILRLGTSADGNPNCELGLSIDTDFQGMSYSINIDGDYLATCNGENISFFLPAGKQRLACNIAIDQVASISGTMRLGIALKTDVSLSGGFSVATLKAGDTSMDFTFTFPEATPVFTEQEVVDIFKRFTADAA